MCPASRAGTYRAGDSAHARAPPRESVKERDLDRCQGPHHRCEPGAPRGSYDIEASCETLSEITDAVVAETPVWRNRPLDPVHPVLLIDAIVVNARDAQVVNRPVMSPSAST